MTHSATPEFKDLLASAMSQLDEGVMITDARLDQPGPEIVFVNPAWERLTGFHREQALGRTPRILQGPDSDPQVLSHLRSQLESTGHGAAETINYRPDGTPFRMAWTVSPLRDTEGTLTHFVAIQQDVTELRRQTARHHQLEILTRVQQEVAAGGLDLDHLRRRMAQVAMEVTDADGAAVEEADGNEMVYRAEAGAAAGQEGLRLPIEASLSGIAYRQQEPLLCTDIETDNRIVFKDKAREVGFLSGILVPLVHEGHTFGVLKVFANEPGRFGEEELHLLELASGVLAGGLAKASAFADEVDRRGLLLDALPALISYVDRDLRYREVNAAYEKLFELPAERIRGQRVDDLLGQEGFDRIRPYLEAALQGERVSYENTVPFADGEMRTLHGDYMPHLGRNGEVFGLYAIVRDITDSRHAQTDFLTGLANRREFERQGRRLATIAQRHQQPLGLIMLDIDHFKAINDGWGHQTGDTVLAEVAGAVHEGARDADLAGRWGGEEFAILLPETDASGAAILAERLRSAIAGRDFGFGRPVTASLGVAELTGSQDLKALQEAADRALYQAKEAGRNRVITAEGA
jgi:diguanylate cyclase (GGDEF)-like protein/PAS domain S-box-containing protein